jgi:hypothetical protein
MIVVSARIVRHELSSWERKFEQSGGSSGVAALFGAVRKRRISGAM